MYIWAGCERGRVSGEVNARIRIIRMGSVKDNIRRERRRVDSWAFERNRMRSGVGSGMRARSVRNVTRRESSSSRRSVVPSEASER